jgi:DNA-binding CsgD family transcriptional regulator
MKTVFVLALVFASVVAWGQELKKPRLGNLDSEIATHAGVPGLAVAVTKDGKIIYQRGFGWADRERGLRATPKTPFALASVSKSITATAIMQLVERGRLNLDAPVNDYLGSARVHGPRWNAAESTVRRVMSHTGGLTTFTRWCGPNSSACNLDREIRDYGILVWPPGELFDYSNLGFGILGKVIAQVSGNGNIPASVQAMKAGAVEFLTKPFDEEQLFRAIDEAIERDRASRQRHAEIDSLRAGYDSLTHREQEVMQQVVSGLLNKQIAAELDISEFTVKVHRGQVMRKMHANSLADLVRMAEKLGIRPPNDR